MWVILLDKSSSMADPFEAEIQTQTGRVRALAADNKWQAAKKSVFIQLDRLGDAQVSLIAFDDEVSTVVRARADSSETFERALAVLRPGGGTDIAGAIRHLVSTNHDGTQVLLITDGLSDDADATVAAREAHARRITINVFVIDPTEAGIDLGKKIARLTNGAFERITSEENLERQTADAASGFMHLVGQGRDMLNASARESGEIAQKRAEKEEVTFTAGYAAKIEHNKRYPLTVYAHLYSLLSNVQARLAARRDDFGTAPATASAASSEFIARGRLLTITPRIRDLFSNPPKAEVIWEDDIHELNFQVRYAGSETKGAICSGFIDVAVDGLLVSQIPLSVQVAEPGGTFEAESRSESARFFSGIFACHAREDQAIVRALHEAYRLLGVHLWIDTVDLPSGIDWQKKIAEVIQKQDLFQLYWSHAASRSEHVVRETDLAIEVASRRAYDFIRPLFWEPNRPDLPQRLSHLHFTTLDVSRLNLPAEQVSERLTSKTPRSVPLVATVIPLTSEPSPELTGVLQDAMTEVVPFLEATTGLRYYPVPTLIVDDFFVKRARQVLTVDKALADPTASKVNLETELALLRSLGLMFHTRKLHDDEESDDYFNNAQVQSFYGFDDAQFKDYEYISYNNEGQLTSWIRKYLDGQDVTGEVRASFEHYETSLASSRDFLHYVRRFFDCWLDCARRAARARAGKSLRNGYAVAPSGISWLTQHFGHGAIEEVTSERNLRGAATGKQTFRIRIETYAAVLEALTQTVSKVIDTISPIPRSRLATLTTVAATYGIFASPRAVEVSERLRQFSKDRGWPEELSFSDTPKVLISANALARQETELNTPGMAAEQKRRIARNFLISTLAHEHFHAILETGLDVRGRKSLAADSPDEWRKGVALNESLAAWMQLEFFRSNQEMFDAVLAYVKDGEYPVWPYRGAVVVETVYKENGMSGVRAFIEELRRDPEVAQDRFSALARN